MRGVEEFEWVFAYGSLVWRPGFHFLERNPATITGWSRAFTQDSPDHRGTPAKPGRVVTLAAEPGACCDGVAYKIAKSDRAHILSYLDERESGGYTRRMVDISTTRNTSTLLRVKALTYIALPDNPNASTAIPEAALAKLIMSRRGASGDNVEYVLNLAAALEAHQIFDPVINNLAKALKSAQAAEI